jgi:anti-anti-sigma factor
VASVGELRPGDHRCVGFHSDDDQREVMSAFVRDGLTGGQRVVYVAGEESPARLRAWLDDRGPSLDTFLASGQLVLSTAERTYYPDGRFDSDLAIEMLVEAAGAAAALGYRGIRLASEMAWALRGVPGTERVLEFEAGLQRRLVDSRTATMVCQYDLRLFTLEELVDVERLHDGLVGPDPVYSDGLLRITRTLEPPGLALAGDIDASNADQVARWLSAALAGGADVTLDLSQLEFCDIGGLRAIVAAAAALEGGRRLVLHRTPPHLWQVMRVVGWDDVSGLVMSR